MLNKSKELNNVTNQEFKIGEKVWVNIASFMPKSTLADDGTYQVWGTIVGFTPKRIIADCDCRGVGYYKSQNISKREVA